MDSASVGEEPTHRPDTQLPRHSLLVAGHDAVHADGTVGPSRAGAARVPQGCALIDRGVAKQTDCPVAGYVCVGRHGVDARLEDGEASGDGNKRAGLAAATAFLAMNG